jgi:transcriptional regulator with XRE-family HTH domain
MTAPPPPALDPWASLAQLLQRLLQRLKGQRGGRAGGAGGLAAGRGEDGLRQAGQRLQRARLSRGLGLRQLADETRISTPVLEALERGWRERLPEAAYLRTMLPLLEEHLQLEPGSLREALPTQTPRDRPELRRRKGLWSFQPGSIEVFSSWTGTLLYALLMLLVLLGLNRHQLQLAQRGLLSIEPLSSGAIPRPTARHAGAPSSPPAGGASGLAASGSPVLGAPALGSGAGPTGRQRPPFASADEGEGPVEDLLAAFPELRPLRRAASGQSLAKLRQERLGPDLSLGQLRLQLAAPTKINLTSRGGNSSLTGLSGELALPVLPPFALRLDPPPAAGSVRWNNQPLSEDREGRFRYPPAARP